jgi:hypothetical protein
VRHAQEKMDKASLAQLDIGLFQIEARTSGDDQRSLLAVEKAIRKVQVSYLYLE